MHQLDSQLPHPHPFLLIYHSSFFCVPAHSTFNNPHNSINLFEHTRYISFLRQVFGIQLEQINFKFMKDILIPTQIVETCLERLYAHTYIHTYIHAYIYKKSDVYPYAMIGIPKYPTNRCIFDCNCTSSTRLYNTPESNSEPFFKWYSRLVRLPNFYVYKYKYQGVS